MKLGLPTWEASKEIADKLPPGGDRQDDKCPECGTDLSKDPREEQDQKARR